MIVWPCYWIQPRDERRDFAPNLPNLVLRTPVLRGFDSRMCARGLQIPRCCCLAVSCLSLPPSSILFFLYSWLAWFCWLPASLLLSTQVQILKVWTGGDDRSQSRVPKGAMRSFWDCAYVGERRAFVSK